jgi:hypothetical protein
MRANLLIDIWLYGYPLDKIKSKVFDLLRNILAQLDFTEKIFFSGGPVLKGKGSPPPFIFTPQVIAQLDCVVGFHLCIIPLTTRTCDQGKLVYNIK